MQGGYQFPLTGKELEAFHKINEIMLRPENFVYFIDYRLEIIIKCEGSLSHIRFCILQYLPDQKRYVSAGYYCKVLSAAQACYSAMHSEILGLAVALKSLENLIAGALVTCYTDFHGLMLLVKHAVSKSKSFKPVIKLR